MGTAKFAPGEIDRIAVDLAVQLAATRAEDGCEAYNFARDVLDPNVLHIAERWRDSDALKAHSAAPHVTTFGSVIAAAKLFSISVKSYDGDTVRTLLGE